MVADLAFELGEFNYAEKSMKEAKDYSGLLLYYSSIQNRDKLKELGEESKKIGLFNISFTSFFILNDIDNCYNLLIESKRFPEASIFCRTYYPSKLNEVIDLWNNEINEIDKNSRMTIKIVNPVSDENKEILEKSENQNMELYKNVSEASINDLNKYLEIFNSSSI